MKGVTMSKSKKTNKGGRVTPANANSRRYYSTQPELPLLLPRVVPLLEVEDRRTFHPELYKRPARSFFNSTHTIVARPLTQRMLKKGKNYISPGLAFQAPENVLVCHRRKTRTEVLHALGKGGRTGQKTPRRNHYSNVSCK